MENQALLMNSLKGKKLLVLGGSHFQLPAIKHALSLGIETICCDYLPDNPGHLLADKSYIVSTTDLEAVLSLAQQEGVDGVLAFASDPAALTAGYINDHMGLPGLSYQRAHTLTYKPRFREFLRENNFLVPNFVVAGNPNEAVRTVERIGYPCVIKPADSSGSKGVSILFNAKEIEQALVYASSFSRSGEVVIEKYLEKAGQQIAGDGLVINGELVYFGFADEHFVDEKSAVAPIGESFPSQLNEEYRDTILIQLQRLVSLLHIENMVFNLDAIFDLQGRLYFIDLGPRAGGNFIPSIIKKHAGIDLMDYAIRFALGGEIPECRRPIQHSGYFASWVLHARFEGYFKHLKLSPLISNKLVELSQFTSTGQRVNAYRSSRDSLGCAILEFSSMQEMHVMMSDMYEHISPVIENDYVPA